MKYLAVAILSVLAGLAGAFTTHAQSVTTIHTFNNTDGATPEGNLTLRPDGNFYSTTRAGGSFGEGTVFKVTTNGTLTTLTSFDITNGSNPLAGLTLGPGGNFYGTAQTGGASGPHEYGTVFKVTTNGTLTTLASFNGANGSRPQASLTLGPDGNLYGASISTLFKVTTGGTLTALVAFNTTNGANPYAGLTLGQMAISMARPPLAALPMLAPCSS